jgi:hypothetical protein
MLTAISHPRSPHGCQPCQLRVAPHILALGPSFEDPEPSLAKAGAKSSTAHSVCSLENALYM